MALDVKMKDFLKRYVDQTLPGEYLLQKAYIFFTGKQPPENVEFPGSWYPEQLKDITPLDYYQWQVLDQLEDDIMDFDEDGEDMVAVIMLYMLGEFGDRLPWNEPAKKYRIEFKGSLPVSTSVEVEAWSEEEAKIKAFKELDRVDAAWKSGGGTATGIVVDGIQEISA